MFLYAVGFGIVTAMVGAGGGRVDRPVRVTNILNLANGYVTTGSAFVAYVSYSAGLNPWWEWCGLTPELYITHNPRHGR
jgi:hypothetical protein